LIWKEEVSPAVKSMKDEGTMAGEPVAVCLPLHLDPLEKLTGLLEWIKSWAGQNLMVLKPLDWFERDRGITSQDGLGGGGCHTVVEK
jgi:hypothetical protein